MLAGTPAAALSRQTLSRMTCPSSALVAMGNARLLKVGGWAPVAAWQRRSAATEGGGGKTSALSSVFRAAAVALRLPRLLPKVPEGYWQNFWPERQAEAAKVGLGAGALAIAYVPYSVCNNVSFVVLNSLGIASHSGSFFAGAVGGGAAVAGLVAAHKLVSVDAEEMKAQTMAILHEDWKMERILGGNVQPGAQAAYAIVPAAVLLEKQPSKSVSEESYLACYKWRDASMSLRFDAFGDAGQATVSCHGVKSMGRCKITVVDVDVRGVGVRRILGGEDAQAADKSLVNFANGAGGSRASRMPARGIQISNLQF